MALTSSVEDIIKRNSNGLLGKHAAWERVRLGDIAEIQNGAPYNSALFNNEGRGMPLLRIRDVGSDRTTVHYNGPYEEREVVRKGDLVIGMDGAFNCALWAGEPALLNQRVCRVLFATDLVRSEFVFHALPGYLAAVNEATPSVTVKHLSSKTVADLLLPLPPFDEQGLIVQRLRSLDALLEEALDEVGVALELASQLRTSQTTAAFDVADTWPLDELATIQSGITKAPAKSPKTREVPYLRTANVQAGRLDLAVLKTIPATEDQIKRHILKSGDVLIIEGGDADKVGRGWIWGGEVEECIHQNHVFAVRPRDDRLLPEFLAYYINSPLARDYFAASAKQTTNLASINKTQLKSMPIPALSRIEQEQAVSILAYQFETVSELRAMLDDTLLQVSSLRRGILRSAFAGGLTDPEMKGGAAAELLASVTSAKTVREKAASKAVVAKKQRAARARG